MRNAVVELPEKRPVCLVVANSTVQFNNWRDRQPHPPVADYILGFTTENGLFVRWSLPLLAPLPVPAEHDADAVLDIRGYSINDGGRPYADSVFGERKATA